MRKIWQKITKSSIFFVLLALVIIMLPASIYKTAESERRAITVMVGVNVMEDSPVDEQVELSLLFLTPQSSNNLNKNYAMVSVNGSNISDCLTSLQIKIGKKVGLSHCQVLIISESVAKSNVLSYLDSFTRTNDLTTNALLICSEDPKKLIEAQISESEALSLDLMNILNYNSDNIYSTNLNLEKFYSEYFDESSVSYLPIVNAKENEESQSGGEESQTSKSNNDSGSNTSSENSNSGNDRSFSEESSTTSSGSQGPAKSELDFTGKVAVFQEGTMVATLEKDDAQILKILSENIHDNVLKIENVSTQYADIANYSIRFKDKDISYNYNFVNGYPVMQIDMNIGCKLIEINADKYSLDTMSVMNARIDSSLENAIIAKLKSMLADAINFAKDNNIDMFQLRKYFQRLCTDPWHEYMLNLDADDNFMQGILFLFNIHIIDKS